MIENVKPLLELPIETLAALATGYLAYRLAYTARDFTHKATDVLFIAAVFAFIGQFATATFNTLIGIFHEQPSASFSGITLLLGMAFSIASAGAWRSWIEPYLQKVLFDWGISRSDRTTTALDSILKKSRAFARLTVVKRNGEHLMCQTLEDWNNAPIKGCLFGDDGSVALYVTARRSDPYSEWEQCNPDEGEWGKQMTYIPAAEISEIWTNQ